jgi:aminomethyltransferase
MKKTPLYDLHLRHDAKLIDFAGFLMPIQYEGVSIEHNCVKNNVGVFDVSHMGEFIIYGQKSETFLQSVLSNDISILKPGQAQYNCIPNENGGIIDDLILYKLDINKYMLVVNASNIEKNLAFLNNKNDNNVNIDDLSEIYSLISIQGPNSLNVLEKLFKLELANLKYYSFLNHKDLIISNTGYTGCGGYEIYCKNDEAVSIWNDIFEAGSEFDIKPVGLAARDTLRLEMGFCLYGNELNDEISPIEAGLSWITKTNKIFTSSSLFIKQKKAGVTKKLIGFEMLEKAIPRKGYIIYSSDKKKIGVVTSGTMSPYLKKGIGLGYVKSIFSDLDNKIFIEIRGNMKQALIVKTPFK